ncbi:hypothetical protein HGM15179_021284, partial [Zosterops borbonicus]
AQTTQLLVEPPWRPAVLWDQVTLTCQGLGTAGATTWYKDGQRLRQEGLNHFTVTETGTYQCERPGSGFSPTVSVSNDWLVLQVPARPLLEGDTVTLRCRGWWNRLVTQVRFYHGNEEEVAWDPVLEFGDVDVGHSGTYQCVATNQLGQDGHRVFWALSPELALEVTPGSPWVTAVAVNVGRTLLFLVLLLAVIGGCHCWHRQGG